LPKKSAKKLAFLTQNKAKLCNILIITLAFEKNANFFAENIDHNIDPSSGSNCPKETITLLAEKSPNPVTLLRRLVGQRWPDVLNCGSYIHGW
jgi:hypothetical protein